MGVKPTNNDATGQESTRFATMKILTAKSSSNVVLPFTYSLLTSIPVLGFYMVTHLRYQPDITCAYYSHITHCILGPNVTGQVPRKSPKPQIMVPQTRFFIREIPTDEASSNQGFYCLLHKYMKSGHCTSNPIY